MFLRHIRLLCIFFIISGVPQPSISQAVGLQFTQDTGSSSSETVAKFKANTRLVTLEVIVRDGHDKHVSGLKAEDFQLLEQAPARSKEKREQKIAVFREVRMADLAGHAQSQTQLSPGVYTNLVTLQRNPVPPTILLVDGLNTELQHQSQVHVQMVRMLKSLPTDVPVAVFLFGHRLQILQDFTTDPRLLQEALAKAASATGVGMAKLDPRDDPKAPGAQIEKLFGAGDSASTPKDTTGMADQIKKFDQEVYAGNMDMRVNRTIEALTSLARHIAGYPGRKNLLWISSTFPIYLRPFGDDAGYRNYWPQLVKLCRVLSDAKVAVYPINPAGVQVPALYEAGTIPRDTSGTGVAESLSRETQVRANEQDTMEVIADGTGGKVCSGSNDLGECVRKAVDDASAFYEIAYYPDAQNWNGEYRRIFLKARQSGLRLAYRQGYYATAEGTDDPKHQEEELRQAACDDYLSASSVVFAATKLPPDAKGGLRFYLGIDPSGLTLLPTDDGGRELNIQVGVCSFDKEGVPQKLTVEPIQHKLTAAAYQTLVSNGLSHVVSISGSKPSVVRFAVLDILSHHVGSVAIKVEDTSPTAPSR